MKFTTPCFVRVENADERKELIEWLESIGYLFNDCYNGARSVAVSPFSITKIVKVETRAETGFIDVVDTTDFGIDCGTDVELFKGLAAMNDENDRDQWFVTVFAGSSWCIHKGFNNEAITPLTCRKATAGEIISHFKKKNI